MSLAEAEGTVGVSCKVFAVTAMLAVVAASPAGSSCVVR